MKQERLIILLQKVNIARRVSDHLLGEDHPLKHRMVVGGVLMLVGVGVADVAAGTMFHVVCDLVGYMVHGAGTLPFIDWLTREKQTKDGQSVLDKPLNRKEVSNG